MRILRLDLLRYGPFTDRTVTFRPGARLHLVYGPNEAGKSSSLAAVGDLLFGFPKRREYDFIHDAQSLRIGAEIVARGGQGLSFRRRRGRKRTLLSNDAAETSLQEDALAPFLGNLGREVFSRAFGLNPVSLRQGGEAMLESEGELGAALFAAASGLTGLARIRRGLEDEADAIFAPRASRDRSFYQALERYDAAIADERRDELKSGDWKALNAEIAAIEAQLGEIRARRAETAAALGRLQRLKRLEPMLQSIDRLVGELTGFRDLPLIAGGFLAGSAAALEAAERSAAQERLAAEEVAAAMAALDAIKVDARLLAKAAEITDLFSRKGDYLSKLAERPRIAEECDGLGKALSDLAHRLGYEDADAVVEALPPDAVLDGVRRAAAEGLDLETQIATEEKRLVEEVAALVVPGPDGDGLFDPKPWRDQLTALAPDLKELAEKGYLESSLSATEHKLDEGIRRLVPRVSDIGRIVAAGLPSREAVAEHKTILERLHAEQRAETARLEANARQRQEVTQRLGEIEQGGPLAYEETIRLVRADRDATFALLRSQLLREGRLMTPAEAADRVAQFEEESYEADSLADQAIADAERISRLAGLGEQLAELERQRPQIEMRLTELDIQHAEALATYEGLFVPAGIVPAAPEAMLGWLGAVEDLWEVQRDAETLVQRIAGLDRLAAEVRRALMAIAERIGVGGAQALAPLALSRLITAALDEMSDRWATRRAEEGARQAGKLRVGQIEEALGRTRRRYDDWRRGFAEMLPRIGLDREVSASGAAAAIAVWQAVPDLSRERAGRAQRLAGVDRDIAAFEASARALARQLAPVLTELPPQGLIDVLREQAETARAAKARRDDARARLEAAEGRFAAARTSHEAAAAALERLTALLPQGSDVRVDLKRLERREQVRTQLDERRHEFAATADGMTEAAVRAELADFDRDRAAIDAEDLERVREGLNADNDRLHAMLGQKLARREALESGTGAELAAFERQSAEAEITANARRWAVRKIAATMLGAAMERHRESQTDPLMLRAGALFRTLTNGSFAGLVQDYDEDDQPRLVGVRAGGERVAIAGMSEGTRDQLYLALRLAYIEDYAERAEPVPFIGDDIFQTFDDERTGYGIEALASTSGLFQPILFTHHLSVVAIARSAIGDGLDYIEL